MDGLSPVPRHEADARYDLARLAELLPQVEQHLRTLGVDADTATTLGRTARELRQDIGAAREASLMAVARRIPA